MNQTHADEGHCRLEPPAPTRPRAWPLPRQLPRRIRTLIRRQAAAAARQAAAHADAVQRERLALHALDLLGAGWPKADVIAELLNPGS
jgi:hypothetical protein